VQWNGWFASIRTQAEGQGKREEFLPFIFPKETLVPYLPIAPSLLKVAEPTGTSYQTIVHRQETPVLNTT